MTFKEKILSKSNSYNYYKEKNESLVNEIDSLKKELSKKKRDIDDKNADKIRNASEEAKNILQNAKDFADRTIREFNKAKESGASIRELEEKRDKLRKKIDNYSKNSRQTVKKKHGNVRADDLHVGDSVEIVTMGVNAIVNTLPDSKGNLFVLAGSMRTKVNVKDLSYAEEKEEAPPYTTIGAGKKPKAMSISPEINLIGMTVDDAVLELGKFLDDAGIAHLSEVCIVHGKGTGALRNGIHKYLKNQKSVKSFRLGEYGEGDAGVTIATLR